jgi:cyclopropane fatty-acyl-phospholipid synthase-like methyltransferase
MKLGSGHFESNAGPILQVLKQELNEDATVLEVASGYGQHAAYFAQHLPKSYWQPSDIVSENLLSIAAYVDDNENDNLADPISFDVRRPIELTGIDAIVSINLLHVSGRDVCDGLLKNAGDALKSQGKLFLYGPFIRSDVETAQSNVMFDQRLKMRDPSWGIPVLDDVSNKAADHGLQLHSVYELPSNNVVVVFERTGK